MIIPRYLLQLFQILLFLFFSFQLSANQRKIALIIAIGDYAPESEWISTSANNDVRILTSALLQQGFDPDDILIVKNKKATKQGILKALKEDLMAKINRGDIVFFHFSGHGQRIKDNDGEEEDGYDEALVPYDSPKVFQNDLNEGEKLIRDDELSEILYKIRKKLGINGHLLTLLDTCYSGTGTRSSSEFISTRGTSEIMAEPEYQKTNPLIGDLNTLLEKSKSKGVKLASFVAFFAAGAHQTSEEIKDKYGTTYGSLSYTFCEALIQMTKYSTYQDLFNQILQETKRKRLPQLPEKEGIMNQLIFNGKLQVARIYYVPQLVDINANLFSLNAGRLQGLTNQTRVAFYPSQTYDTTVAQPKFFGRISHAEIFESNVILDQPQNLDEVLRSWVFIKEQNYVDYLFSVQLDIASEELEKQLANRLINIDFIELAEKNPDIRITLIKGRLEVQFLRFTTKTYKKINLIGRSIESLVKETIESIQAFARAQYLRDLEINVPGIQCDASLEPTKIGQPIFQIGDKTSIKIKNRGTKRVYFALIEVLPDNEVIAIDRYCGRNSYVEPGGSQTLGQFTIQPPTGLNYIKIILAEKSFDLCNIGTSTSVPIRTDRQFHPLEQIVKMTELTSSEFRSQNRIPITATGTDITSIIYSTIE